MATYKITPKSTRYGDFGTTTVLDPGSALTTYSQQGLGQTGSAGPSDTGNYRTNGLTGRYVVAGVKGPVVYHYEYNSPADAAAQANQLSLAGVTVTSTDTRMGQPVTKYQVGLVSVYPIFGTDFMPVVVPQTSPVSTVTVTS